MLAASASAALALSESPIAGSSPATTAAPAPPASPLSGAPATKVVPSDESEPPAGAPSAASATAAPSSVTARKPRTSHKAVAAPPEVEPAAARLRVTSPGWIYAAPSNKSKKIEKATIGKFVDVTGSTKYYLQAKLRSGQTGYISPSDVELVKPIDKVFLLSQDAAVLEAPNKWARKLAEVHRGHHVQVVGIALNYMRIRMKSGLTGFIPLTALQ